MAKLKRNVIFAGDECVEVVLAGESIHISGYNFGIEIRERTVIVRGAQRSEVHSIRNGRKKVVYIWFNEIRGFKCAGEVYEELTSTIAHLKRISLPVGDFINIVLAGRFMFDYAVLGRDVVALILSGKREVYVDREKNVITVYVV